MLEKIFGPSWRTSVTGTLAVVCAGTDYAELLPEKYRSLLHLTCGVLVAFGLIAAKDKNVSHSPVDLATPAKVVAPTDAE